MNTYQPYLLPELSQTVRPQLPRTVTIEEQFQAFDRANPHVYRALRDLCLATKRQGFSTWSIKAAWELLRWSYGMQTQGDAFKLPNSLHSRYARTLMARESELANFFETRELRSE